MNMGDYALVVGLPLLAAFVVFVGYLVGEARSGKICPRCGRPTYLHSHTRCKPPVDAN